MAKQQTSQTVARLQSRSVSASNGPERKSTICGGNLAQVVWDMMGFLRIGHVKELFVQGVGGYGLS